MKHTERTETEAYFTTGRFRMPQQSALGKAADRYHRHCGPTALTNLLITFDRRADSRRLSDKTPEEIFEAVAAIGTRRLFYVNTDWFRHWGGTSDLLSPLYLASCFRTFDMPAPKVAVQWFPTEQNMVRALSEGAVLFLQVHMHPKYGFHHMLCYGFETCADGSIVFRVADGWRPGPVAVSFEELKKGWLWLLEVRPR